MRRTLPACCFSTYGRDWSAELLDALEIPREWLPRVFEGSEATSSVRDAIADELGLPRGLTIAARGGDNAAAAVGVGVVRADLVSSSVGNERRDFAHRDTFTSDPSGRVHAFCHALPGVFHLLAVTLSAGGPVAAWQEHVAGGAGFEALVREAAVQPAPRDCCSCPTSPASARRT